MRNNQNLFFNMLQDSIPNQIEDLDLSLLREDDHYMRLTLSIEGEETVSIGAPDHFPTDYFYERLIRSLTYNALLEEYHNCTNDKDFSDFEDLIASAFPDQEALFIELIEPETDDELLYRDLTVTYKGFQWGASAPIDKDIPLYTLYKQVLEMMIKTGVVYQDDKHEAFGQIMLDIDHRLKGIMEDASEEIGERIELLCDDLQDGSL